MNALKSTAIHTLEIAVVLGIAYLALTVFGVSSEIVKDAVVVALAAAVKYVRASDLPVKDYVNK